MGLTLIFGVMNIINFAHGEFLMLSMYATFWLGSIYGLDPYLSLLIIIPGFFFVGLFFQKSMIDPLIKAPEIAQIFATVGLSIVLQNLALLFFSADYRTLKSTYSGRSLVIGDLYVAVTRLIAFGFVVCITIVLFWFLKNTFWGKAIRATAQNREAAQLMGVNIKKVYSISMGIGISCVAIAGAVLSPIYSIFPNVGVQFVLIAFIVVVLGGMGNLKGAFLGGIIIGLIETLSGFFITPPLKNLVYFIIFILILLLKPTGLFQE
jgi:branched-chain amino acid transport system permease protein